MSEWLIYLLSLVELFERLAFAVVLPLFALYLHEPRGYTEGFAIALSSGFLAATYMASLPGGFLTDRFLGTTVAVFMGAILLTAGFVGLATDRTAAFWPSLVALLVGQGFVKPSISVLIGQLYPDGDRRREAGFLVLYVAINLGSLAGPLLAEWARARWGWPSTFVCAAGAMGPVGKKPIPAQRIAAAVSSSDQRARLNALTPPPSA